MAFASATTRAIHGLAEAMAGHMAVGIDRLSGPAMGKGGFFSGLGRGKDCTTATAERVLNWLDGFWPEDLPWPAAIMARPSGPRLVLPSAAELAQISHEPIWANGRRPPWWPDLEVREFLTVSHRQMSTVQAERIGQSRFGARCPRKSAIHTYWQRLDQLERQRCGTAEDPS